MNRINNTTKAFTIVELLIVIVVIAILAAISIVAYSGIQDRANKSKVQSDIAQIIKAVTIAREQETKPLFQIIGRYNSGAPCWSKPNGTDLAALPTTDNCWVYYNHFLDVISEKSGMNVRGIVDPWGRPYMIDESEGESAAFICVEDLIAVYRIPLSSTSPHPWTNPRIKIPLSRYAGCTT